MATPLLIGGGTTPLQVNPEYLPYGGSLVSSVNGETGAITITGSGIATISTPAPNTINVAVPAGAAQTLSQAGNIVSLSGGGGSVDISTTTLVAATATKTTQQTYVGGGFLETQFGGQVKSIANIVSQPPLGGGSVVLEGGLSKVAIGSANASITAPSVEFQDGATLGTASVAYDGTQINVDTQLNAGANQVKTTAVPSANEDLCNKLYVDSAIGGVVDSVNAGTNISVDNTDPANPIVSLPTSLTGAITFTTNLPQCSQVPSAGADLVNKTYVDGLFPPTADTLANVLLAGNNAGATSIDMNQQSVNNVAIMTMRDDLALNPQIQFKDSGNITKASIAYDGSGTNDQLSLTGNDVVLDFAKGNIELDSALFMRLQTQDSLPIRFTRETAAPIVPETTMELAGSGQVVIGAAGSGITAPSLKLQGDTGGSSFAMTLNNATNKTTFSTLPQCSAVPSAGDDLVNKTYVDGLTPPAATLANVLIAGNSAGATSIDMNNQNITATNTLEAKTITALSPFNFSVISIFATEAARNAALPTPYTGQFAFITGTNVLQYYNSGWNNLVSAPTINSLTVSGFTLGVNYEIIYVDSGNNVVGSPTTTGFTIYRFYPTTTTSGSVSSAKELVIDYLIVGGGGGGGGSQNSYSDGGGGGAGGFLLGSGAFNATTSYNLSVGGGGAGGVSGAVGVNGANSSLVVSSGTLTAVGGGAGAGSPSYTLGNSGGSGGGGCGGNNPASTGGSATGGQGNAGGAGFNSSPYWGGGGGGAGAVGSSINGNGGNGSASSITGTSITYAGGGGGGTSFGNPATGGNGGSGGGGQGGYGSPPNTTGQNGTNGLGGGGGGGGNPSGVNYNGGQGGSGVVIIRFASYT